MAANVRQDSEQPKLPSFVVLSIHFPAYKDSASRRTRIQPIDHSPHPRLSLDNPDQKKGLEEHVHVDSGQLLAASAASPPTHVRSRPPVDQTRWDDDPNALGTYNVCRMLERSATTNDNRMHARILGHLILHAPCLEALTTIVTQLHSCNQDENSYSAISTNPTCTFRNHQKTHEDTSSSWAEPKTRF